jgi:DNA repair protein RadA/Sms
MNLGHNNKEVNQLNELEVPDRYRQRIMTGSKAVDMLFGGDTPGIAPFMSVLLTGEPGAGKTTFVMGLADMLECNAGLRVLYNAGEQNKYVVKMTAERMELDATFEVSQFEQVDELLMFAWENDVNVIIQDSIQTLHDGDLKGRRLIESVGEKLTRYADTNTVLVIAVGQITKNGQMAGPMVLKHMVDAHAHMGVNKRGTRIFEFKKNRFGPTMARSYTLRSGGLKFDAPVSDNDIRIGAPPKKAPRTQRSNGFFSSLWRGK